MKSIHRPTCSKRRNRLGFLNKLRLSQIEQIRGSKRTFTFELLEKREVLTNFAGLGSFASSELIALQGGSLASQVFAESQPIIGETLKNAVATGALLKEPTDAFGALTTSSSNNDNSSDPVEIKNRISQILTSAGLENVNVIANANDSFRIQFGATKNLAIGSFSSGLTVLPITSSAFNVSLKYSIDVTVGKDAGGFYLDASATPKELQLDAFITNTNLPSLQLSLGAIQATATPRTSSSRALDATFLVDIGGGKIKKDQPINVTFSLTGNANVSADLIIDYTIGSLKPQLSSGFTFSWGLGAAGQSPRVAFSDVQLDVGSIVNGYGSSALKNALEKAKPVFDLAGKLSKPLPGLEQLSQQIEGLVGDLSKVKTGVQPLDALLLALSDPNLLSVLDAVAVFQPTYANDIHIFTSSVRQVNEVGGLLQKLVGQGALVVNLGSFKLGESSNLKNANGALSVQSSLPIPPSTAIDSQGGVSALRKFLSDNHLITDLLDPLKVFQLLAGSDQVTLLEYSNDLPKVSLANVKFVNENFVVGIVPANFQINATLTVDPNVRFGFSSRGIVEKNFSHGIYVGAGQNAPSSQSFIALDGAVNVDLSIGQDYELASIRAGVRGSIDLKASAYFVESAVNPGKLYVDQFSASCPLGGSIEIKADISLFADASLKLDAKALISTLKSLVESAIKNNPSVLAAKEMLKVSRKYLEQAGVKPEVINRLIQYADDPKTALKAITDGFETVGNKASSELKQLSNDFAQGKKDAKDYLNEKGGSVAKTAKSAGAEVASWFPLALSGGLSTGYSKSSVIFSQPIYTWPGGTCSGNDFGGGLNGQGISPSVQAFRPILGEVSGGVLNIYVGPLANKRSVEVGPGEIDENVVVSPLDSSAPGNGNVQIAMFGFTQSFSGVVSVFGDAGNGNNSIDARGLGLPVTFFGGNGNDTFFAGTKTASLYGGDGDNSLTGSPENDLLFGGKGIDTVVGLAGDDAIETYDGNDLIYGDYVTGSSDDLAGTTKPNGNDHVNSGDGNDFVYGGGNDDWIDTGLGNDIANGGVGSDTLYGSGGHDHLIGGQGNDFLYSGQGNSFLEGGDGDDKINAGSGSNLIVGGIGNDTLVGGDAVDVFYYSQGDGNDTVDGGGSVNGILIDFVATNAKVTLSSVGSGTSLDGNAGTDFSISMIGIDEHLLSIAGVNSQVFINNLAGSVSRYVSISLGTARTAPEQVFLDGSELSDEINVSIADSVLNVAGLASQVEIRNMIPQDRLTVSGRNGDDKIKVQSGVENSIGITLDGGAGNDTLSADAILIGGPGDDFLQGGLGNDQLFGNDGDDTMIGGPGLDTYDGGLGFDKILVLGTPGNDSISITQSSPSSLTTVQNAVSDTDNFSAVESVEVRALEGNDIIGISVADNIVGSLAFRVDGGAGSTADRLVVKDEGLGDLDLHRLGATPDSGSINVGTLSPIDYLNIERVEITPINSATGSMGSDGFGRIVVLPYDRLESNNSRVSSTLLGGKPTFVENLSIDPGTAVLPALFGTINGDEDWFEFSPDKTGSYRFEARFKEIGSLANGRPGLPGNGNLDVSAFNNSGIVINTGAAASNGEFVDVSMVAGSKYYARVTGNANAINTYNFVVTEIDLAGPQVTGLSIPGAPLYDIFAVNKSLAGPTPVMNGISIKLKDDVLRAAGDIYPAILAESIAKGLMHVVGDNTGVVAISRVDLVNDAFQVGSFATATVTVTFASPLPDDRYTLTVSDSITDPAGNRLNGESNATTPESIKLPSGNGTPGGDFIARFTVDSRPEIGTVSQGLVYVDINGNSLWDPTGLNNDATNRDFVMQIGTLTDATFAGNFAMAGAAKASGFDKLGVYGKFGNTYSFLIDTNDDGVGDYASVMPAQYQVNGIPVAGNFNAAHPGDEIGLFDGKFWYLDTNGNNQIDVGEQIPSDFNGLPIVGDFDGNGTDDLATYANDTNTFYFDMNRDGRKDSIWEVRDSVRRFAGLSGFTNRPVAGDLNLDGIDDIGLWVKGRGGQLPVDAGEYFFWVSDRRASNPASVFDPYSPAPLGNDLFAQFGNENALPIFGNFDPPVMGGTTAISENALYNQSNSLDVDGDGSISPLDALIVINVLNSTQGVPWRDSVRAAATIGNMKVDTDGDWLVSPLDVLLVINHLNNRSSTGGGEGEGTDVVPLKLESNLNLLDHYFANLDDIDVFRNKRR